MTLSIELEANLDRCAQMMKTIKNYPKAAQTTQVQKPFRRNQVPDPPTQGDEMHCNDKTTRVDQGPPETTVGSVIAETKLGDASIGE